MEESLKDLLEVVVLQGGEIMVIYIELKNGKCYFLVFFPQKVQQCIPFNLFLFHSKYCPAGCLLPFAEISGAILMDIEM